MSTKKWHSRSDPEFCVYREVRDPKGHDRLLLRLIRVPDTENAWNFDALIWETRRGEQWIESLVFTHDELQGDNPRRRWANDVSRFDAVNGNAIVKIGEESERDRDGIVRAIYSWWICDIRNKRLVELIRICERPHEKYDVSD